MFKFSDKPQAVMEILRDGFSLYKQTFSKVWYLALAIMILASLQKLSPMIVSGGAVAGTDAAKLTPTMGVMGLVLLLLLMFVSAFFITAILHRIHGLTTNPNLDLNASFTIAKQKIVTVFAAVLIITVLVMIGAILFVIPGIIAAILLIFYLPNIIFQNDKIFDSLKHSIRLVGNVKNWLRTFAVLLPAGIIMAGSTPLLMILMGKDNMIGIAVAETIIATIVVPFLNSVILVQYHDLRLRQNLSGLGEIT